MLTGHKGRMSGTILADNTSLVVLLSNPLVLNEPRVELGNIYFWNLWSFIVQTIFYEKGEEVVKISW